MNSITAFGLEYTLSNDLFYCVYKKYRSEDKDKLFVNDEGWRRIILRLIKKFEETSSEIKNKKNKKIFKLFDEAFLDKLADVFLKTYNSQQWVEEEPHHADYNNNFNHENYKMRVFCIETMINLYKKEKNKLIKKAKKESKKIELEKLLYKKRLNEECLIS
jgi:hypothetical protein